MRASEMESGRADIEKQKQNKNLKKKKYIDENLKFMYLCENL